MTITPIHHWKCNAKSGAYLVDEIAGGGPGTGFNVYSRQIGTGGKFNSCVLGPTGLVNTIGLNNNYTFGAISFWFRRRSTSATSYLLSKSDGSYSLYITASSASPANKLQKKVNTSTIVDCGPTISDTNWHHIVIVETSSTTESIYVDGTLITDSIAWFYGGVRYFSYHSYTDNTSNVDLDNIQWYDRLLDSDEVDFLFNATSEDDILEPPAITGSGGFVVGGSAIIRTSSDPVAGTALPLHHWKCNAKSGNYLVDEIAGGGPGTGFECEFRSIISGGKFNDCVQGGYLYPCGLDGNYTFSSLSFWFRRTDLTKKSYLLSREGGAYALYITPDTDARPNELQKKINTTGTWYSDFSIADTDWHHIVITETASDSEQLYIDGVLDTNTNGWFVNGIRYFSYHSLPISGVENVELDNIQWYDRILAAAEVVSLYNAVSESITRPSATSFVTSGGFIIGGEAEIRANKDSITGSGGFIVGGSADIEIGWLVNIDGIFPDIIGDTTLVTTTATHIDGTLPDIYGEVSTSWVVDGVLPDIIGDCSIIFTTLSNVDGILPSITGDVVTITTNIISADGILPDIIGDITSIKKFLISFDGIFPDIIGDISTTRAYYDCDGILPDVYGLITLDLEPDFNLQFNDPFSSRSPAPVSVENPTQHMILEYIREP